jgi:hypothetical protein
MPDDETVKPLRRRRRRIRRPDDSTPPASDKKARWFIVGMAVVGLICLIAGFFRREPESGALVRAVACLGTGIAFVAIGLLELEWLERIVAFVNAGILGWMGTMWYGSLSESELVGRSRAVFVWVGLGSLVFLCGCLIALRVI